MDRQKGRCCSGILCQFPNLSLNPQHTCKKCGLIVHILCADRIAHPNVSANEPDESYICFKCRNELMAPKPPPPPASPTAQHTIVRTKPRRPCKACGRTDHQRKSSLKCPMNPKNITAITTNDPTSESPTNITNRKNASITNTNVTNANIANTNANNSNTTPCTQESATEATDSVTNLTNALCRSGCNTSISNNTGRNNANSSMLQTESPPSQQDSSTLNPNFI